MKLNSLREQKDEKERDWLKWRKQERIFFFKLDFKGKWVNE